MKNTIAVTIAILFILTGCKGGKQSEGLITVDVTAGYPKKELILQDFMDVEYIPLETTDEFLTQGFVLSVGKDIVLVRNYTNEGDLFIFDRRTGKGIKKINRKGEGGEEYTYMQRIVLDEDTDEIFVHDHFTRKIVVYDLEGNFKRVLKQDDVISFAHVYNFDRDNLICNNYWVTDRPPFTIISKQDGSVVEEIRIPFEKKIQLSLSVQDKTSNMTYSVMARTYNPIIPNVDNWMLVEPSSDTIYSYSSDRKQEPLIVRTPPIQSMNPEVFLFLSMVTDRYYFMDAVKKEYDWDTHQGFPATDLVYDKQEKTIYEYTIYNNDYVDKKPITIKSTPLNKEIISCQILNAPDLVEAYEKGQLKGRLKEIAATLDEESNPVVMLVKHKK